MLWRSLTSEEGYKDYRYGKTWVDDSEDERESCTEKRSTQESLKLAISIQF